MPSDNQNLEYSLPQNAYATFDAVSLKNFIIDRLNQTSTFRDQNYEGSNLSSIIEILAFFTHVQLFYLNQTSSESMFSQATIYENMNKIVGLLQYKPTGKQTSMVPIHCRANSNLPVGSYLFRKYSYVLVDSVQYTLISDVAFEKILEGEEDIESINNNVVLYQGTVGEYPIYTAEGVHNETFPIVVDNLVDSRNTSFISHGTISVYVKESATDTWFEYTETSNLFLTQHDARVYDLRLNENGHYEVKFGNDVFGRSLQTGDEVAVFYVMSNGEKGQISKNVINGNRLFLYNSSRFDEIYADVSGVTSATLITTTHAQNLTLTNPSNSTVIQEAETVDQIRSNVPVLISSQLRLVSENDYEVFLKKSVPNIIHSVKVVSNQKFLSEYIDYFYRICVDPNRVTRVILNQVNFADSCDFNNVNVFIVPTFDLSEDEMYPDYLSNNFKNLVVDMTADKKIISSEVVPRDPVYVAFDLGYTSGDPMKDLYLDTKLLVVRDKADRISVESLRSRVASIIVDFFHPSRNQLGQKLDMSTLTSSILALPGVRGVRTINTKENTQFNGISFVSWNPSFDGDEELFTQTTTLPFFKFPYLFRPKSIATRIEIVEE